ncbi:hypothetical protein U9M48_023164 [Paspalum notatum var. saurae]|uniref:Small ribosomal subunit protein bS18c n=1 Tax=Paspalum notatum var. saurae TaxID=547442 RepID=A0AAQ3WUV0_PASNO
MASSALRRSIPRRASLRHACSPPHRPSAAAGAFRRSFQSGNGETPDEFEERLLRGRGTDEGSFFNKLDRAENTGRRYSMGSGMGGFGDRSNSGSSMGGFGASGNRSSPGPSMGGFGGFGDRSSSGPSMGGFGASGDWRSSGPSMGGFGGFGDRNSSGPSMGGFGDMSSSGSMGVFDSLNDGVSEMLGNAARNFQMEDEEDDEDWDDDFEFRPDVRFRQGATYNVRDLDLTRPAAARNPPKPQFETTTAEVLKKADFRNVRFLAHFLTEAGIIIKRSQTRISAKAQRKVAREIKTARAFGLMPFTTMGRRPFVFGRSAEEHYSEEEYGFDFVRQKDGEPVEDNGDAEPDVEAA